MLDLASLTLLFYSANFNSIMSSDLGIYNYGLTSNVANKFDPSKPEDAVLYFQQSFTNIFENFLSQDASSDSFDGFMGSSSGSSSSSYDPFSSSYDFYSQMINLQTQQSGSSTSSSQLELLNGAANLIEKEAVYSYKGQRLTGMIQSVVNDNGKIYFKIDGDLIQIDQLLEVRKAV